MLYTIGLNGEQDSKIIKKVFKYKLNVLLISTCSCIFSYISAVKVCKIMEVETLSNEWVLYTKLTLFFLMKTLFKIRCWMSLYKKN